MWYFCVLIPKSFIEVCYFLFPLCINIVLQFLLKVPCKFWSIISLFDHKLLCSLFSIAFLQSVPTLKWSWWNKAIYNRLNLMATSLFLQNINLFCGILITLPKITKYRTIVDIKTLTGKALVWTLGYCLLKTINVRIGC